MDPMQPPKSDTPSQPQPSVKDQLYQATGEYVHNNYETWIRKLFGFAFTILSFIRSTILQIIAQVFSK